MTQNGRGPILGIDLGTTNSLVAVFEGDSPRLVPNANGDVLTPSAVSCDPDDEILVGAAAAARATTHPTRTARSFKRAMGTDRSWDLGFGQVNAVQLSALVLRALREDAEAFLGAPVHEAIVTVPAYFGEHQRRATKAAAAIAGLHVERIVNEPTAAALAFGLHHRDSEQRVVVVDLGGGTFDVTVLEIIEGIVEIQASAGDIHLGGDDFVDAIVAHIAAESGLDPASPKARARYWHACQRMVIALTNADVATTRAAPLEGDSTLDLRLERATAEVVWGPLLDRVRAIVRRALRDASVLPGAIDEVLMVGGASRMPCVVAAIRDIFGREPNASLPPDEAIALGAAVQGALKARDRAVSDLIVTDIAPFTMGIEVAAGGPGARTVSGIFSPILQRGTTIPASRVSRYHTMETGQTKIDVKVYQGEHALCADNTLIGAVTVAGIPKGSAGSESIDVRFTYDLNGILEVEATVVSTGRRFVDVFHESGADLSPGFVERARKQMERLKIHPRELLPNRTSLERADACFAELIGDPRGAIGELIAMFLAALETQEPERIEAARRQLDDAVAHQGPLT